MYEKCDCGHEYCEGYKLWLIDPFVQEIYDEVVWDFMCHGDEHERAMDI